MLENDRHDNDRQEERLPSETRTVANTLKLAAQALAITELVQRAMQKIALCLEDSGIEIPSEVQHILAKFSRRTYNTQLENYEELIKQNIIVALRENKQYLVAFAEEHDVLDTAHCVQDLLEQVECIILNKSTREYRKVIRP